MSNSRLFLKSFSLAAALFLAVGISHFSAAQTGLHKPLSVYVNWAAYDELSDTVRLTESLAMRQLTEAIRLKQNGVQIDYYLMDAFWFAKDGGLKKWRKKDWPNGNTAWKKACKDNGIQPGLWFPVNYLYPAAQWILDAPDEWKSSLSRDGKGLCLFDGEYLKHFMGILEGYADEGFRLFKFDFFDMNAVTPGLQKTMSAEQVRQANFAALRNALKEFKIKHPGVLLIAYNGFGGNMSNTGVPIQQNVEKEWLEVFDAMYCGDPRPADVPVVNFWRSKDIYSDHMVRYFKANGFPLNRIDNAGFMIGKTGTCYYRDKAAWKGMLLLSLARGGWMNTYYGDLSLLSEEDARWFAKAQQLFYPLQQSGSVKTFGGLPGKAEPYGYVAASQKGTLVTLVNPSRQHLAIALPVFNPTKGRILFTDSGFVPLLKNGKITLGPEQLAVVGLGEFAKPVYDFGTGEDIHIPTDVGKAFVQFKQEGNTLKGTFTPTKQSRLKFVFRQTDTAGIPFRTTGGSPPDGTLLNQMLLIKATQDGKGLPLSIAYDKAIWSGLSWAVAELDSTKFTRNKPLTLQFTTTENAPLQLHGEAYYITLTEKRNKRNAQ